MTERAKPSARFLPQLDVAWERRSSAWWGDLGAFWGPRPRRATGRMLFYDKWTARRFPLRALFASALVHLAFFVLPMPSWRPAAQAAEVSDESERMQLTWFGPARDLPLIAPPAPAPVEAMERLAPTSPGQPTVLNPRQTIISSPLRPNHPRQTLIQPQAPPAPPKILPPLPNVVQWSGPVNPPRPKPVVTPLDLQRARRTRAQRPPEELPLPAAPNNEIRTGELNIASAPPAARPALPLTPMSVPNPGKRRADADAGAAPQIDAAPIQGAGNGLPNLIALSAEPAPPAPNLEVPMGNLSARFAAAPAVQPRTADAAPPGAGAGTADNGNGAGGSGPPGIVVSGASPENRAPVAGPPPAPLPSRPLPSHPQPRDSRSELRLPRPGLSAEVNPRVPSLGPGYSGSSAEPVEKILGSKRIYTLHINMPNLTSAAGSWILRFAELNPNAEGPPADLSAPMPVRKVDPRYPPVLMEQRIEGEVRLYAIIRADGSVDSIQVLRSLHAELDRHSMEALAKWQFRPAGRNGIPIDVEAVVSIPFRLTRPL
ncbi:MAG: energy transducer TonB [Candidatus Acidiferrales bacterium]